MKYDKETFKEVLEPHHRTYWKIAYTKLQRKMQSLKSSLKKRSEDADVKFDITMEDLRETGAGIFEGMTWSEIEQAHPEEADLFRHSRDWSHIKESEPDEDRRRRGARVLRFAIDNHTNVDSIVMFAHAGIIQQIVCAILESPRLWGLAAKNTAIYEFSIDISRWDDVSQVRFNPTAWRILRFNEQPHLS